MKTPLCGMLTLAAIYFTAQTTTPPTGKVGINTTEPTETLDVKGKVRIQGLYSENDQTGTKLSETDDNKTFTATDVVTANANGVLGKKSLSSIIAAQTPNFPWKKVGTTDNAVPAEGLKIYSKYAVGIGDYSATNSSVGSSFEINGGGTSQLGLINGNTKWDISTEDKSLTFTKRKPENGRIFSITDKAIIYLGNTLLSQDGSGAKLILDGGNGKIGINKNSADYNLDVAGDAKISGLKTTNDDITSGSTTSKYLPAKMVVADANGVLGKVDIPTIPTIPTEPWQVAGSSTQATSNSQDIYQSGKVGIGSFGSGKNLTHKLEVEGNTELRGKLYITDNGNTSNNDNYIYSIIQRTEGQQLLFEKNIYVKSLSATQTGVMASLTNTGKIYLGKNLTKEKNVASSTNNNFYSKGANILLDGENGTVGIGKNSAEYSLDVNGYTRISNLPTSGGNVEYYTTKDNSIVKETKDKKYTPAKMVVVDDDGVLGKAEIPTGGGSGNGVTNHTGSNDAVQCNAANAGTIHYKEGVTVNGNTKTTSVMGFCMKTADSKYRWFYIFGGAGTTTGSEADAPNFGDGL